MAVVVQLGERRGGRPESALAAATVAAEIGRDVGEVFADAAGDGDTRAAGGGDIGEAENDR